MTILLTNSERGSKESNNLRFVVRRDDTSHQEEAALLTTTSQSPSSEEIQCNEHQHQKLQQLQAWELSFPIGDIVYSSQSLKSLKDLQKALNDFYAPKLIQQETGCDSDDTSLTMNTLKSQSSSPTEEEEKRFELFRQVLTHEDGLLNERVSWILLAQSFLMAPYVMAGNEPFSLRFVTATVGIISVVVTLPAIFAAGSNIEVQQQVYFRQISSDERCQLLHGHKRDLTIKPNAEEKLARRLYGHVLPNMAFRSNASMRILWTALLLAGIQFIGWTFLLAAVILDWD